MKRKPQTRYKHAMLHLQRESQQLHLPRQPEVSNSKSRNPREAPSGLKYRSQDCRSRADSRQSPTDTKHSRTSHKSPINIRDLCHWQVKPRGKSWRPIKPAPLYRAQTGDHPKQQNQRQRGIKHLQVAYAEEPQYFRRVYHAA